MGKCLENKTYNIGENQFTLTNMEIFLKGNLMGYMTAIISLTNSDKEHELLYRLADDENGKRFTLVTIDYGYYNPLIEKYWDNIERACFDNIRFTLNDEVYRKIYNQRVYKVGFTKTKIIEEDGLFGVTLVNQEYKGFAKNPLVAPCRTYEEMQIKIDEYAENKNLKQVI